MKNNLKKSFLLLVFFFVASPTQASVISDFSWVPTSPVYSASTILPDGTKLTLTTDSVPFFNWSPYPDSAKIFRLYDYDSPVVTLTFSRPIQDLRLWVHDLDQNSSETLSDFSVVPTAVDGALLLSGGVVSSLLDDSGGNLTWLGLNDFSISFTFNRCYQCGLFLREIEFTTVPVPLPPSSWLMAIGLLASLVVRWRGRDSVPTS